MSDWINTDILICGAGAAGLTLAVDLARRGVAFRIVEKAEGPFAGSSGLGPASPAAGRCSKTWGCSTGSWSAARPYPAQRVYRADGGFDVETMSEARDPTPDEPYAMPLLSPQFLTERALRERLEALGGRVQFGRELTAFSQDDAGVTTTLAGPGEDEVLHSRYLIGADGGRSFVRHALGVDFPGATLGIRAVVADVQIDGLGRDAWHRWREGGDQIGICPLWGTELFQLQAPIPVEGEIDLSAEGLSAMVAARTGRADLRVTSVAWASAYSMNARLADRYRVGRVLLAGDAAHIHPPTGGQGLNTSLQDAYNLGWKLAAVLGGAPDALLDSYEAERRPVAAEVLGLSSACSVRPGKAGRSSAGARPSSSTSAIRARCYRLRTVGARRLSKPATGRRMRRSELRQVSLAGSSISSGVRTGRCWATRPMRRRGHRPRISGSTR